MRITKAGARPTFAKPILEIEWESERMAFPLRVVLLVLDMIYREAGAARMRIEKILGDDGPYKLGVAADVSVSELPGVVEVGPGVKRAPLPAWICKRVNLLFPFGDGSIETATYDGAKIVIRVPTAGYRQDACALGEWQRFGPTGMRVLTVQHKLEA